MAKIIPNVTRFCRGGLNYTVRSKASEAPEVGDMWNLSESSMGSFIQWPKSGKKYAGRMLVKSGDDIQQAIVDYKAEKAMVSMSTTGGTTRDLTGCGKRLVIRNGKPLLKRSVTEIRDALMRIRQTA